MMLQAVQAERAGLASPTEVWVAIPLSPQNGSVTAWTGYATVLS